MSPEASIWTTRVLEWAIELHLVVVDRIGREVRSRISRTVFEAEILVFLELVAHLVARVGLAVEAHAVEAPGDLADLLDGLGIEDRALLTVTAIATSEEPPNIFENLSWAWM